MEFILIDHCTSDYFSGHHLPVIQVPVYSNMRTGTVLKEIKSELNQAFDMYEQYTDEMIAEASLNWLKADQRKTFVTADKVGEDQEPSYLYFVLGEIERGPLGMNYAVNHNI